MEGQTLSEEAPIYYVANQPEDTIDLFEVAEDLWRYKWLIMASTIAFTLLAVLYLWQKSPVYQTQVELTKPSNSQISELYSPSLNFSLSDNEGVTETEAAFAYVRNNMKSYNLRKQFWHENEDIFKEMIKANSERSLSQQIDIFEDNNVSVASEKDRITLTLKYKDDVDGVALANDLTAFVLDEAKKSVASNWESAKKKSLNSTLFALELARGSQLEAIEQEKSLLQEALEIAQEANITEPQFDDDGEPEELYLLGTTVLKKRIKLLKDRKLDDEDDFKSLKTLRIDGYGEEIAPLKRQARSLDKLSLDESELQLANIAREAAEPYKAVSPRKKVVLVLGFLFGGALGVFVATVRAAWVRRQANPLP